MFGRGESPKWVLKEVPRISPAAALGLLSQPSRTRIGDKKLKHGQRFCIEHDERTLTWAIGVGLCEKRGSKRGSGRAYVGTIHSDVDQRIVHTSPIGDVSFLLIGWSLSSLFSIQWYTNYLGSLFFCSLLPMHQLPNLATYETPTILPNGYSMFQPDLWHTSFNCLQKVLS